MTAVTAPLPVTAPRPRLGWAVADTITVAWRNLRGAMRTPQVIVFSTIQPVIFVLNFRYVFGNAISGSLPRGVPYVDFLMPGIFVQTITFGATGTAVAMATDLGSGLIERFRSLPMSRVAVMAGRTVSDLVRNSFVLVLMLIVGSLVGFRIHAGVPALVGAFLLLLLFMFALSWMFATVGLVIRNPEAAQAASFPILAVLVFASSAFVPTSTMPGPLRAYAENQPVSDMADAVRALVLGGPTASKVVVAIAWCLGIIAVFAPLAIARYRRAA
ncbi:MAG TPA: ABC transporter permease [Acidimicrobiales bacterium]|nr:ABC transporter permease [Acidimicrobiales bacterium]